MPRKSDRPHRAALTRMLRATGLARVPEEAPLVELLRTLADELDEGGGSRPRIEYRAALKDARSVMWAAPGAAGASRSSRPPAASVDEPDVETPEEKPAPGKVRDLESFKRAKGSASTG